MPCGRMRSPVDRAVRPRRRNQAGSGECTGPLGGSHAVQGAQSPRSVAQVGVPSHERAPRRGQKMPARPKPRRQPRQPVHRTVVQLGRHIRAARDPTIAGTTKLLTVHTCALGLGDGKGTSPQFVRDDEASLHGVIIGRSFGGLPHPPPPASPGTPPTARGRECPPFSRGCSHAVAPDDLGCAAGPSWPPRRSACAVATARRSP
jgi:hypothetical protein